MSESTDLSSVSDAALIVGAGHAAGACAMSLREQGWTGRIVMVGDEPYLPYQRPPLSKSFLSGEVPIGHLYLIPQTTYDHERIDCILGTRVERIDRTARSVALSDGRELTYTKLVLATGGRPRRLAILGFERFEKQPNFHYLRT